MTNDIARIDDELRRAYEGGAWHGPALREVVALLDPARLEETAAGQNYSLAVMLHGVAQHMAYHGGQIALLKKLAAG